MTSRTKQIIVAVIVIIIAFFVFKIFFVKDDAGSSALVADKLGGTEFVEGQKILNLLDKLNGVTLDDSVFSDEIFVSLADFEQEIANQVIGRLNPFSPIGTDNLNTILPRSTTTGTVR